MSRTIFRSKGIHQIGRMLHALILLGFEREGLLFSVVYERNFFFSLHSGS